MKKKLLLLVICIMTISFANAQITSLALVGSGTTQGWPADPQIDAAQLTSTDGENWTATNLTLLNGAVKFRGNNSWALPYNWGGATFPTGTAVIDGAGITTIVGVYNVSFNSTTGAYSFVKQVTTFQVVSILGDATPGSWTTDTDMNTIDGTIYTLTRVALVAGVLKFRGDHSWTLPYNWGGTGFPSGTAVVDANAITIPSAGIYTITFNKTTLAYSFSFPSVALVGPGAGGWPSDPQVDAHQLTTTDGVNYTLSSVVLTADNAKFRANNSWSINWGATTFPAGTGVLDSPDSFLCVAGTYNVTFNYDSGAYSFTDNLGTKGFTTSTFHVYPNPAQSNWNFSSSKETIESIQVVDILGKTILTVSPKNNEATIDASGLNSGIYFAKMTTATATNTIKIIKK